jgi:hypothetical protein
MKEEATLIIPRNDSGTSDRFFHVTGIAENWRMPEENEEAESIFTKADFENALRKVSRKIKK